MCWSAPTHPHCGDHIHCMSGGLAAGVPYGVLMFPITHTERCM